MNFWLVKWHHKESEKTSHKLGESICNVCNCQRISTENIQRIPINPWEKDQSHSRKRMNKRVEQTLHRRENINGQWTHEMCPSSLVIRKYKFKPWPLFTTSWLEKNLSWITVVKNSHC